MSIYESKNWQKKLDRLFGPIYPDIDIASKNADEAWQRAFDNVLEGVDEMIVDHLSKAFGWTSDHFDSRLLSDIEADQLFGPNSYCWTVKFFSDMTPIN